MGIKNIRHIGIVTASIEKSKEFYCGCLGFEEAPVVLEKGPVLEELLAMDGCQVNTCKLNTPDHHMKLELLEFLSPASSVGEPLGLSEFGLTHFAITVDDIESIYKKVKELKFDTVSEPVKTDGGPKVFFMKDLNNIYIEIVEE